MYRRHYYSPHWATGDHTLWILTVEYGAFDHIPEQFRRARAKNSLRHVLDNKRWVKSEYAWEADAWTDVFGQMRSDAALGARVSATTMVPRRKRTVSLECENDLATPW